jgi:hypothetical protein
VRKGSLTGSKEELVDYLIARRHEAYVSAEYAQNEEERKHRLGKTDGIQIAIDALEKWVPGPRQEIVERLPRVNDRVYPRIFARPAYSEEPGRIVEVSHDGNFYRVSWRHVTIWHPAEWLVNLTAEEEARGGN